MFPDISSMKTSKENKFLLLKNFNVRVSVIENIRLLLTLLLISIDYVTVVLCLYLES